MPVLRAHYHILLLGNLVTMQVLTDFQFSYFACFWTASCAEYFLCATSGISSFSFTLAFYCTIPVTRITEKFGATLVYHLLSQTLWSYWKPSTLYLKHMPLLMTCNFICTCCLVLTLQLISLINAAMEHCISDICMWMLMDKLKLNDEKMESMCNWY